MAPKETKQDEKVIGVSMAQLFKISTVIDGGLRITIDLPGMDISLVSKLIEIKNTRGGVIKIVFFEE